MWRCVSRISPPVLPIQFGVRNEHMAILRQGTFIQFESSQKMNGVFVAVLLREVISPYKPCLQFTFDPSSVNDVAQPYRKRRSTTAILIWRTNGNPKKNTKDFSSKLKRVPLNGDNNSSKQGNLIEGLRSPRLVDVRSPTPQRIAILQMHQGHNPKHDPFINRNRLVPNRNSSRCPND
jgi:hypothetical protein